MSDEVNKAASQPVVTPQTSDEKTGKGNMSMQQATNMLLRSITERVEAEAKPAEQKPDSGDQVAKEAETPVTEQTQETETATGDDSTQAEEEASADSSESDVLSKFESLPQEVKDALKAELEAREKRIQEKIDKRIGKEVGKKKALEEALEATRRELEELRTKPAEKEVVVAPPPNPNDPLADVLDESTLEKRVMEAKTAKRWAEAQLDRDDFDDAPPEVNGKQLSKSEVKAILRNAAILMEDHVPVKQQQLRKMQEAKARARSEFQWWHEPSSAQYQMAKAILRERPYLATDPEGDIIISQIVEGRLAYEARKKGTSEKKAPATKVAPKPPSDQVASPAVGSFISRDSGEKMAQRKAEEDRQALKKKGNMSERDAIRYLFRKP